MRRKRDELIPIGEALAALPGPVQALRDATPQALHYFTLFDQVYQLVSASKADPDLGFVARMMMRDSLESALENLPMHATEDAIAF